jgi:hypothetical protein
MTTQSTPRPELAETITRVLDTQPIVDMHTHLYPPTFGTPAAPIPPA